MRRQAVVIDNGSGVVKAGLAGAETPSCVFENVIGRPKHRKLMMSGALEGSEFIGKKAQANRGLLRLERPVDHGVVQRWDEMEKVWRQVFEEVGVDSEEQPVLITEAPLNPRKNREQAAQILFETFNVPALFVSMQPVLSLYASGRTTGVVLDSGDGVTHAVPIFHGFAVANAVQRMNLAGRDVTDYMRLLLQIGGHEFHTSAELEIVRQIKESACYVAPRATAAALFRSARHVSSIPDLTVSANALNSALSSSTASSSSSSSSSADAVAAAADSSSSRASSEPYRAGYRLPDGNTIDLGAERYLAPEILFKPELVGEEYDGIQHCLSRAIQRSDRDMRQELYENIVLAGGSTTFKYFGDRLLQELKALSPADVKLKIYAPPDRLYTTWTGGSILASLGTFKNMWLTSDEWRDEGVSALHRKTF